MKNFENSLNPSLRARPGMKLTEEGPKLMYQEPRNSTQDSKLVNFTATREHWGMYFLPYVFQRVRHARYRHVYIVLNRNYKPIAFTFRDHIDYYDYAPSHALHFHSDPMNFRGIWTNVTYDGRLYLYDDGLESRRDYMARLKKLMAKPVTMLGRRGIDYDCFAPNKVFNQPAYRRKRSFE